VNWLHLLLDRYRSNSWSLNLDADELFVYPHYENTKIAKLCDYLDFKKCAAILTIMLDMYSSRSIKDTVHYPDRPLIETCPYFDAGPYKIERHSLAFPFINFKGGARRRYFWRSDPGFLPPHLHRTSLAPTHLRQGHSMPLHILHIQYWDFEPKDCIPTFVFVSPWVNQSRPFSFTSIFGSTLRVAPISTVPTGLWL
jgi:hypothetical protein